jgi:hypothetical protein
MKQCTLFKGGCIMADVSKFVIGGTTANVKDATARSNIGDLSQLTTSAKTDLVVAINEAATTGGTTPTYNSSTETITFS